MRRSARCCAPPSTASQAPEALSHAAGICEGGYGTAVDVWSLGITVIELSERDPPFFDASSVYGAMLRIVQGPPAKCRALEAQVEDAVA